MRPWPRSGPGIAQGDLLQVGFGLAAQGSQHRLDTAFAQGPLLGGLQVRVPLIEASGQEAVCGARINRLADALSQRLRLQAAALVLAWAGKICVVSKVAVSA